MALGPIRVVALTVHLRQAYFLLRPWAPPWPGCKSGSHRGAEVLVRRPTLCADPEWRDAPAIRGTLVFLRRVRSHFPTDMKTRVTKAPLAATVELAQWLVWPVSTVPRAPEVVVVVVAPTGPARFSESAARVATVVAAPPVSMARRVRTPEPTVVTVRLVLAAAAAATVCVHLTFATVRSPLEGAENMPVWNRYRRRRPRSRQHHADRIQSLGFDRRIHGLRVGAEDRSRPTICADTEHPPASVPSPAPRVARSTVATPPSATYHRVAPDSPNGSSPHDDPPS